MPLRGFRVEGKEYAFSELFEQAREGTAPVPSELLTPLVPTRNDDVPSASSLTGCLRKFSLQRQHDYYQELDSEMAPLFGTAMHLLLQQHAPEHVRSEQRLEGTIEVDTAPDLWGDRIRITIGGTADYVDPTYRDGEGLIRDYKTKIYLPANWYPPFEHRTQVNIYNLLWSMQEGHRPLKWWEIVYLDQKSQPQIYRGETADVNKVYDWLAKKLTDWWRAEQAGRLPAPVKEFYERTKDKKPVAPCSYCPVRQQCLLAWKQEQETQNERDDPATATGPGLPGL